MLDRLAQLVPGWTERNPADPLRHRRRGARPHRRPHLVPPGRRRHRGVPRHGAQPHLACAATPGCSTTACTRAARRAPGCTFAVTANSPVETQGLDADETLVVTGGVEHTTVDADQLATCSPVVP